MDIPEELVDKYYEANNEFEYVLPSSKDLKDGMIVLTNEVELRQDTARWMDHYRMDRADAMNRWCEVTELDVGDRIVSFVGVYANGIRELRWFTTDSSWIVKRDDV